LRLGNILRQVIIELEVPLEAGRLVPYIPDIVAVILASRIQAINNNNTRYY